MSEHAPGVLIIDDEPAIRQLLELVCERAGLRAYSSNGGDEAVATYERHRGEISLVLLDVNMPAMDGPTTLARLRQVAPDVRVCFMSGDTGRYSVDGLIGLGAEQFFEKPFRFDRFGQDLVRLATTTRAIPAA